MMLSEIVAYLMLALFNEAMYVNAAYFILGASGGAVLIASQYTANL
jgi:hypothetical protein